jgi:hypothetical protein
MRISNAGVSPISGTRRSTWALGWVCQTARIASM